jgi:hypothetical protein
MVAEAYTIVKNGAGYTFDFGPVKFEIGDDGKDFLRRRDAPRA